MTPLRTLAIAGLSAVVPSLEAFAQHALDANLQVGSGGRNARSTTTPTGLDFRARNLIVTDSVAGGRGFRGSVGYSASGDFTGNLGSDDSLAFRSNSALSDLLFITSPQRLDAFNIAQGTGVFEFRRDFASLPEFNNVYEVRKINDAKIRLDRTSTALQSGSLLATSVATSDIGHISLGNEGYAVTTSTLEGLGIRPEALSFEGLTIYDRAEARQAMAREGDQAIDLSPVPFVSEFERAQYAIFADELATKGQTPPAMLSLRIENAEGSGETYEAIVERILEQYADRKDIQLDGLTRDAAIRSASTDIGRVKAQISGRIQSGKGGALKTDELRNTSERYEGLPRSPVDGLPSESETPDPGEDLPDIDVPSEPTPEVDKGGNQKLSINEMAEILRHRTEVRELSIIDRGRLARAVHQGENAMQEGRFFKAERCFDDAVRMNPGNPLLELARANAQIGAGLYLSAALTLQRTFRVNVEVIDARFKPELLPNRTRLEFAVLSIRERLQRGHNVEGYGISLAYIGHQLGDVALINEGLTYVKGDEQADLFGSLLRGIWLGDPVDPNAFVDPLPVVEPEVNNEAPPNEPKDIPGPSLVP